eukprot:5919004-Pleurochrysis_carterae.AAC.1
MNSSDGTEAKLLSTTHENLHYVGLLKQRVTWLAQQIWSLAPVSRGSNFHFPDRQDSTAIVCMFVASLPARSGARSYCTILVMIDVTI